MVGLILPTQRRVRGGAVPGLDLAQDGQVPTVSVWGLFPSSIPCGCPTGMRAVMLLVTPRMWPHPHCPGWVLAAKTEPCGGWKLSGSLSVLPKTANGPYIGGASSTRDPSPALHPGARAGAGSAPRVLWLREGAGCGSCHLLLKAHRSPPCAPQA